MSREDLRSLAASLVAIPSHEDEAAVGAFIAEWLREETDATVWTDDVGNVFARRGTGDQRLALVGHHDVVEPAPSQVEGEEYRVEESDGRLYGRGSADMKGALAAMLLAVRDADPAGELVFASFVGEEQGGVGARAAIEDGFAPDYAVVGEGSASYSSDGVLDVAIAHKGRRGSTIEASGTAAHASEPERGENAIYRALDAVDLIRELPAPAATVFDREVTGSLVVTEIDGGTAWNVVPDACSVSVDERTVPGDRADFSAVEALDGVAWSVEQDLPPMRCAEERFAEAVLEAARASGETTGQTDDGLRTGQTTGEHQASRTASEQQASQTAGEHQASRTPAKPQAVVKPHATDAGWLAEAGTTCVVCGPAEPGEAHTDDESVSLSLLEWTYECYRTLAGEWPP